MLPFKNCDFCEKTIPPGSAICPHCGHVQKTGTDWLNYHRSLILAGVLVFGVMAIWSKLVGFR
jgi:hypothetical protein